MTNPTPEEAAHVLAAYDAGGFRAGSFTMSLIDTIQRADPTNRARLALGFPGYVTAVEWAMTDLAGIDRLREVAGVLAGRPRITCPRCARTSHHPDDVTNRYCGACHQYHDQMAGGRSD